MSYQVLARRLRPQHFADVVGQEHVTQTLQAAIRAGRVAHAFLFTGPRGVGKTTTARLLAKALNCDAGPAPEPCNECSTCREIADGSAFDVLEIDGASHTQVDRMREFMETVAHRPLKSRYKVYIIDEVHMLSQHSFNALLKTLEEPPEHVKFIFATTDPHKVLPTVVSRCQRYDLRRIAVGRLVDHLATTLEAEGVVVAPDVLTLVAREAEGSVRDAQSLLEQLLAVGPEAADLAAARALLGAADRRLVLEVSQAMLGGDAAACLRHLAALYEYGYDAQRFCKDLLEHVRHLSVLTATGDRTLLQDLPEAEVDELVAQSGARSADEVQRAFALLLAADEALAVSARSVEPQLVLEMAVLRIATLPPLVPVPELLARLEALEGGGTGPGPGREAGGQGGRQASRTARPGAGRDRGATTAPPPAGRGGAAGAAGARSADPDGAWNALLQGVRAEKIAIYMALGAGRLLGLEDAVFRVGIESDAMRRELTRRDVQACLDRVASRVLARDARVETVPLPASEDTARERERQKEQRTLEDPLVQYAVKIFGGEVRGLRERRP